MTLHPTRLLLLGLLACLSACAFGTQRMGREIDAGRIASLQVGSSTKADVLSLFGPPTSFSRLPAVPELAGPDGGFTEPEPPADASNVFVYEYREDRERFFTAIFFTRFRRELLSDVLMVFFDDDDVVRYVAFAKQTGATPAP